MTALRSALRELTSRQCNRYQVEGGDLLLVPVGSVEVLGPHLPVGGRCFLAEALCRLLAEATGGLCLPVTPYGPVGATYGHPGTVSVPARVLNCYIRAVMDDCLATGFRRVIVVTCLDYLRYYIPQEFYEDHGVAAAGIHLSEELWAQSRELGAEEGSWIAGALLVLGRPDLARKIEAQNARLLSQGWQQPPQPPGLEELQAVGVIGHDFPPGGCPVPPHAGLSAEMGETALRQAVTALAPAVASLRDYNDFLSRRTSSRGMMWRGWRWSE